MLTDPQDLLPELVWCDDTEPGFRRRRSGKGFSYVHADGTRADATTVARIRALVIPPAWDDVWISADPSGHLQATGRDARGRKQYRYHADYRAHRDAMKFERMYDFATALPKIRTQVDTDLRRSGMPKDKVVAAVVSLLELTLVRVGNEEYARDNGSYGLTTLRNRHARFSPSALRLVFKGKHGIAADVSVTDARLRRVVRQCQDLPGQGLFEFVDDAGVPHPISSTDVNDYLRTTAGTPVTAKDFRNTRAVSRASYVHPAIPDWYRDGTLADRWHEVSARGSARLLPEERRLLALLRSRRTGRRSRSRRTEARAA